MRASWIGKAVVIFGLALAGCKKAAPDGGSAQSIAEEAPASQAAGGAPAIKVAMPQIAYIYRYAFDVPTAELSRVIQRHIADCDNLGPVRCRVLAMESGTSDAKATGGTLKLVVETGLARSFGQSLGKAVAQGGGTQSESSIEAEDLSKQIVDTEARLRAKQVLADRLVTLLRNRNGPVSDLVEAERSVAAVQEEIDAAQSWLAEARGRVATSTFEISYHADGSAVTFWEPLKSSTATMGSMFAGSIAMLITLVAALLPWLIVGGGIFYGVHWWRRRRSEEE